MAIIRCQNKSPEAYVSPSRDYQLFCRTFDASFNALKYYVDSMQGTLDTAVCDARLLQLVQTKVGFFSEANLTDRELRYAIRAFPYLIRGKGSLKAIQQAVCVWLKAKGFLADVNVSIDHKNWVVSVRIKAEVEETTLLDELLRYLLPPGYTVSYTFYTASTQTTYIGQGHQGISAVVVSDAVNSLRDSTVKDYAGSEVADTSANRMVGTVGMSEVYTPATEENTLDINIKEEDL